jgi:putative hemolysin
MGLDGAGRDMAMKRVLFCFVGIFLLAAPVASAVKEAAEFGMPNPASQFCGELGGIWRAADLGGFGGAQIGLCRLPDDGIIDEWTLFRAARGTGSQAVLAFFAGQWREMPGPIEGWAEQGCETAGGWIVEYFEHLRPDSLVRLCEFPDRSTIESWTGFSGPDMYPELAKALAPAALSDADFFHCPWPRTCMAPCQIDPPPQVVCREHTDGMLSMTSFACCCCGSGLNSYFPLQGGLMSMP